MKRFSPSLPLEDNKSFYLPEDYNLKEITLFINGQLIEDNNDFYSYTIENNKVTLNNELEEDETIYVLYDEVDLNNNLVSLELTKNESDEYELVNYNPENKLFVYINGQLINGFEDENHIYGFYVENSTLKFYKPLEEDDELFVMYNLSSLIGIQPVNNKESDNIIILPNSEDNFNNYQIPLTGKQEYDTHIISINNIIPRCSDININLFKEHKIIQDVIRTKDLKSILSFIYSKYELNILWKLYTIENIIFVNKLYLIEEVPYVDRLILDNLFEVKKYDCHLIIKQLTHYYKDFINIINYLKINYDIEVKGINFKAYK